MVRQRLFCNCGNWYWSRGQLNTHIGLHNIRWPRKDPSDEHWAVSKEEWEAKRIERQDQVMSALISYGDY